MRLNEQLLTPVVWRHFDNFSRFSLPFSHLYLSRKRNILLSFHYLHTYFLITGRFCFSFSITFMFLWDRKWLHVYTSNEKFSLINNFFSYFLGSIKQIKGEVNEWKKNSKSVIIFIQRSIEFFCLRFIIFLHLFLALILPLLQVVTTDCCVFQT